MKCRKMIDGNVQWFTKDDCFAHEQDAIATSLEQRLSVFKNELWYSINFGLPLFDKSSKIECDYAVLEILNSNKDIIQILSFSSQVQNHKYICNFSVKSIYGEFSLTI